MILCESDFDKIKKDIKGGRKKKHLSTLNRKIKKCSVKPKQIDYNFMYVSIQKEKLPIFRELFKKYSKEISELKREKRKVLFFSKNEYLNFLVKKQKVVFNILNHRKERYLFYKNSYKGMYIDDFLFGDFKAISAIEKELSIKSLDKWILNV